MAFAQSLFCKKVKGVLIRRSYVIYKARIEVRGEAKLKKLTIIT
jgi:hypothetical protein